MAVEEMDVDGISNPLASYRYPRERMGSARCSSERRQSKILGNAGRETLAGCPRLRYLHEDTAQQITAQGRRGGQRRGEHR